MNWGAQNPDAKIDSFSDVFLELKHEFAGCLGFKYMALLRQASRGLFAGLEGDMVWARCNSRLSRAFLFIAQKHSVVK